MCMVFPELEDPRILPKKSLRALARTVSGRVDLRNLPSMKQPSFSRIGFLIWLTSVDFPVPGWPVVVLKGVRREDSV